MIELVNTDNLSYLQQQPADSYDMVITSPPYNLSIDYDVYQDNLEPEQYLDQIFRVLAESYRCLKPGGRMAINVMPNTQQQLPTHSRITNYLESLGAIWFTEIIWDKGGVPRWAPRGTYGSAVKPWFQHSFEYIVVVAKESLRRTATGPGDLTNEQYTEWTRPLWRIQPEIRMQDQGHPAMFPTELVTRLMRLFSFVDDHILDPWGGVGTTAAVGQELGRRVTSIEISEQYHQTAVRRLKNQQQWQHLFETEE